MNASEHNTNPTETVAPAVAQVPYEPCSQAQAFETLLPTNMKTAVADALHHLEQRVGNVDQYVATQLQLENTAALHERFGAEQVDALGLAFSNLEQQQSFIIGDQTGVGKGRFVAAVIEHTRQRGLIPVFVTQDNKLYADMFRDLYDIGVDNLNPLITDSSLKVPRPDGTEVRTRSQAVHGRLVKELAANGELGEFDAVFTTYSQLQTVRGKDTPRRELLRQLAPQSVLILDESHNAGGTKKTYQKTFAVPDRADFVRQLVEDAAGVVYSSATYAKNPYTMTLYAAKTGMREVATGDDLVEMVQAGGVPLQQMMASKLAEAGQYIRRERSYEGIEFEAKVAPVNTTVAENIAQAMSLVMAFDEAKTEGLHDLDDALRAEARQRSVDNSVGGAGATSTNFTSVMHNLINQSLLGLKAEAAVQTALESLNKGEKPVIALSNTMGSLIQTAAQDQDLSPGDEMVLSTGDLLGRYLERSREVNIKDYTGAGKRHYLSDAELGAAGVNAYETARTFIDTADWGDNPISPIDYIRFRLEQEGFRTGEITGRKHRVEYRAEEGENAQPSLQTATLYRLRNAAETDSAGKIAAVNGFNSGAIDALIINRSGSTGISLHASERFSDQRPRRMIVAQPDLNIDVFMQTLGRVHRTGQVVKPAFTLLMGDIPAEKRPAAVLLKKMASLNANTTAARESGFSLGQITDFMNAYGDQVAVELMAAQPNLHERLGRPIKFLGEATDTERHEFAGAISRVTGRIPLLSIAEQEQVYGLIEQEYLELVAREEAMGQSILKAETLDLDARTVASMEVLPGETGDNPFVEPVCLEVMDVKALRKPMTTLEVVNAVREAVGMDAISNAEEHDAEDLKEQAIQQTAEQVERAISALPIYKQTFKANVQQQPKFRALDPDKREAFLTARLQVLDKKLDSQTQHLKRTLNQFPMGQSVRLQSEQDGTVYYGVVEQVIHKQAEGANPVNPSAWKLQIQVADSMGKLRMPVSKINTAAPTGIILRAQETTSFGNTDIYQLFDQRQSLAREQRQIFTGNVIRAFSSNKGKLINFTDHRGQVRQGLLMAKGFDITENLEQQPVMMPSSEQALAFLQLDGQDGATRLKSKDEHLLVHFNRKTLFLNTERGKATGGRYYLDEDLLEAAQAEFVSTGSTMKLRVEGEHIPEVLDYLYDSGQPLYAFEQRGLARQMLGQEMPELREVVPEVSEQAAAVEPDVEISALGQGVEQPRIPGMSAVLEHYHQHPPAEAVDVPQAAAISADDETLPSVDAQQGAVSLDSLALTAEEQVIVHQLDVEQSAIGAAEIVEEVRDRLVMGGGSPVQVLGQLDTELDQQAQAEAEQRELKREPVSIPDVTVKSSDSTGNSPTLQELRDWLQDARINGHSPRYIERIKELSVELLADTDQEFLAPKQRDPAFRNSEFSFSEAARQAMQQDRAASEQQRTPSRGLLLTWYAAAQQLRQVERLEHIQQLGQLQIQGTGEAKKPARERDPQFVNPGFVLSRQDYRVMQGAVQQLNLHTRVSTEFRNQAYALWR